MAEDQKPDIRMDASQLYREEVYTDNRVGSLRAMTPVTPEGAPDSTRPLLFVGQASLMTPAGTLPINFEIPAATLAEAIEGFGPAAEKAVEETMRELQELRRQAASSIVVPGQGGGMPGGGMPGGGIQMP